MECRRNEGGERKHERRSGDAYIPHHAGLEVQRTAIFEFSKFLDFLEFLAFNFLIRTNSHSVTSSMLKFY